MLYRACAGGVKASFRLNNNMNEVLVKLKAIEAKLDAAEQRQRFYDERSPAGTLLCGATYGWGGMSILKRFDGILTLLCGEIDIDPLYECLVAVTTQSLRSGAYVDRCGSMRITTDAAKELLAASVISNVPAVVGVDLDKGVLFIDGLRAQNMAGVIEVARRVDELLGGRRRRTELLQQWNCDDNIVFIEMVRIELWKALVDQHSGLPRAKDDVLKCGKRKLVREAAERMLDEMPPGGYKCIPTDLLEELASYTVRGAPLAIPV